MDIWFYFPWVVIVLLIICIIYLTIGKIGDHQIKKLLDAITKAVKLSDDKWDELNRVVKDELGGDSITDVWDEWFAEDDEEEEEDGEEDKEEDEDSEGGSKSEPKSEPEPKAEPEPEPEAKPEPKAESDTEEVEKTPVKTESDTEKERMAKHRAKVEELKAMARERLAKKQLLEEKKVEE